MLPFILGSKKLSNKEIVPTEGKGQDSWLPMWRKKKHVVLVVYWQCSLSAFFLVLTGDCINIWCVKNLF